MNAKHSHSIKSKAWKSLLVTGAVFCALPLSGQDAWREGRNVAGLASEEASLKQAEATLGGDFTSGEFRTPSEAKTLWGIQAAAQAETHFKDLVLVGNFGFRQEFGSQMMGSMFTSPGDFPVDVLEFTPGNKSKQTYDVGGGLVWKNGSRWTPGFTIRFRGVNYAKRKDLRHTTYRQEIEWVPSILYQGNGWRIGASYILEKTSEFIQAEQIGPAKAQTYYAFLDKGLRYGALQTWDGSGIHLSEPGVDRFPVKRFSNGAALQFSLGDGLYADTEFLYSSGEVGEKGYTWFRFPEWSISSKLLYSFEKNGHTHSFHISYDWSSSMLFENVIEKVSSGGVTLPVIQGNNLVLESKEGVFNAGYTMETEKGLVIEANLYIDRSIDQSTVMYPYVDWDGGTHLFVSVGTEIPLGKQWLLKAGLLTGGGVDSEQVSITTAETIHITAEPTRLQDWWDLEQEVSDAFRTDVSLALRFTLPRLPLYLEAGCDWLHAFNVTLVPGTDRQTTHLTLGYQF